MKKAISLLVRLLVSAGLIAYVIHIIPFQGEHGFVAIVKQMRVGVFAGSLLFLLAAILIDTIRWQLLLRVQGVHLSYPQALALTYGGVFCNGFLLGSTGGDLIKAVLVARHTTRKARAVLTVFLDRAIGLVALIIVAGVVLPFEFQRPEVRRLGWGIYGFLVSFLVGCLVYFHPRFRASGLFKWIMKRLHFKVFHELDAAFYAYRGETTTLLLSFGISFTAHMCGILAVVGFGKALGIQEASLAHYFIFYPIIAVISAIPISVSGWGVGEVAFKTLFGSVGVGPAAAVTLSVLTRLSTLLVGLPGGLVFLLGIENLKVREAEVAEVRAAEEADIEVTKK